MGAPARATYSWLLRAELSVSGLPRTPLEFGPAACRVMSVTNAISFAGLPFGTDAKSSHGMTKCPLGAVSKGKILVPGNFGPGKGFGPIPCAYGFGPRGLWSRANS